MRDFLLVVAVFIVAVFGASAVAWPLYTLLGLEQLQWFEFRKFAKWLALVTIVLATVGVLKFRKCLNWPTVGFGVPHKPPFCLLAHGFFLGLVLFALVSVSLYLLDIRVANTGVSLGNIAGKLMFSILPAALAISFIEETYFRGLQFNMLMRKQRVITAAILPTLFYMSVHFLNPPDIALPENPDWFYGLSLVLSAPAGSAVKAIVRVPPRHCSWPDSCWRWYAYAAGISLPASAYTRAGSSASN